jgi:hypothetical protein
MVQLEIFYLGALLPEIIIDSRRTKNRPVRCILKKTIIAMINNMQLLLNYAYSALIKLKASL